VPAYSGSLTRRNLVFAGDGARHRRIGTEETMSAVEKKSGSGIGLVDTVIVAVAVVGGIFILLWALRIAAGLFLFAFNVAILVVVVVAAIRLYRLFTRKRD
jgi:hypothetical protein